jgi:hypothetical protein
MPVILQKLVKASIKAHNVHRGAVFGLFLYLERIVPAFEAKQNRIAQDLSVFICFVPVYILEHPEPFPDLILILMAEFYGYPIPVFHVPPGLGFYDSRGSICNERLWH